MREFVVIGGGGHAKVVISVLKKSGCRVLGYTDEQDRGAVLGAPWLGGDGVLPQVLDIHPHCAGAVGVGKIDAAARRLGLQRTMECLGLAFPVVISPHAILNEDVSVGAGTVAMDGAVVGAGSRIGVGCILNTNSTIDHDCVIGDNVHVAPGATLSGSVSVGNHCLIGTGANVIQGVSIGAGIVIGAGASVVGNLTVAGTYVGSPARRVR